MGIRLSDAARGELAIAGHAGCGHVHSNKGFIQDDSGGLAAVLALFQEAAGVDLAIREVRAVTGRSGAFEVITESGGVGRCTARRGVTPQEAKLARAVEGRQSVRTQALAQEAFGRMYGQGAHEAPVALQTALANAAVDSFLRACPGRFRHAEEGVPGNCGRILGTVLDFDGVPVSVMAVVNATEGGIGPNEDLEGNAFLHGKKAVMRPLDMHCLPTFIVEGKVFALPVSLEVSEPSFMVRAHPEDDNPFVAQAYMEALRGLALPAVFPKDALKRIPGGMEQVTRAAAETIIALGERLKKATLGREKVQILAELVEFVSQDAGAVTFMSDALHEVVGGVGGMPGSSAVLSIVTPEAYREREVIPHLTEQDVENYVAVLKAAVPLLHQKRSRAQAHLDARMRGELDALSA